MTSVLVSLLLNKACIFISLSFLRSVITQGDGNLMSYMGIHRQLLHA